MTELERHRYWIGEAVNAKPTLHFVVGNYVESDPIISLHGKAIPFFAIKNFDKYKDLMIRAQSLSVGGVIEFRMCKAAARLQGFTAKDIHGFIKMVPMADAEIVRLQQEEGFAYMR